MDAALRLLAENPFSDEAAFAALALIAKGGKEGEFTEKCEDVFAALGGAKFFKRLLTTDGMEKLALNVVSPFCSDPHCEQTLRVQCGQELVSACLQALSTHDEKAVLDACDCLARFGDLTGTCSFLLAGLADPQVKDPVRRRLLEVFAATHDVILREKEGQAALGLMQTDLISLPYISLGLEQRISRDSALLSRTLSDQCAEVLHVLLRDKSTASKPNRTALLKFASTLVSAEPHVLERQPLFCMTLAAVCSIEVRVGLQTLTSQTDLPALCNCVVCLDACASIVACAHLWTDDRALADILALLTSACEATCSYFAGLKGEIEGLDGRATLHGILASFVASVLVAFFADDPIALSGLREAAKRLGLPAALGPMFTRTPLTSLRLLLPLLVELPQPMWAPRLCERDCAPMKTLVAHISEFVVDSEESATLLVFATLVLAVVAVDVPQAEEVLRASGANSLRKQLEIAASAVNADDVTAKQCVEGCMLLVSTLFGPDKADPGRARAFLQEVDDYIKAHRDVDGEEDALYLGDFVELLTKLHFRHLSRILSVIRQEYL